MKITIMSNELTQKLQILSEVLPTNASIPILEHFLFSIENDSLKITVSDLETTMNTTLKVDFSGNKTIAVPRIILDSLKTMANQPIVLSILENNILEIISSTGKYNIPYLGDDNFPKDATLEFPLVNHIPANVLLNCIGKTLFATGSDDLRPAMCGVLFQLKNECFNFVATDAHKLVKYTWTGNNNTEPCEFILPKKTLSVLKNSLFGLSSNVKIEFNENNASFSFENYNLTCRLIDAKYPNYEAVIPKENPNKMLISRNLFLHSLKCISIFSSRETNQIALDFSSQELKITGEDIDYNKKGNEVLVCNYEGEKLRIGFNAKFLVEMLKNISSDDVQLEMSLPNRAGILTPITPISEEESILMLVMPSMLK